MTKKSNFVLVCTISNNSLLIPSYHCFRQHRIRLVSGLSDVRFKKYHRQQVSILLLFIANTMILRFLIDTEYHCFRQFPLPLVAASSSVSDFGHEMNSTMYVPFFLQLMLSVVYFASDVFSECFLTNFFFVEFFLDLLWKTNAQQPNVCNNIMIRQQSAWQDATIHYHLQINKAGDCNSKQRTTTK